MNIVLDTNIFVAALRTNEPLSSASLAILRACILGKFTPLFDNALWMEKVGWALCAHENIRKSPT